MEEARDLMQTGLLKFREFQAKRREESRRDVPTAKNIYWLMDQINNTDKYGVPTAFVVQNPNYFVEVYCLTYEDNKGWFSDKYIRVHLPTDIQNYEAVTEFSLRQNLGEPDNSEIQTTTAIYDTSAVEYKGVTSMVHGIIHRSPLKTESERKINEGDLTDDDVIKIVSRAYIVAYNAVTRRVVPEKAKPLSLGFIQQPFQPRLI